MQILSGKALKDKLREQILNDSDLKKLTFFLYSEKDNEPSFYYLKGIKRLLTSLSIPYIEAFLDHNATEEENISSFNSLLKGKMVILARPLHVPYEDRLVSLIDGSFDPDMMDFSNRGRLYSGDLDYLPATARSVKVILDHYRIDLTGKRCLIVGRSNTVGLPVFELVSRYNGLPVLCHSRISNEVLNEEAKRSDFIFLCSGTPSLIRKEMLNPNTTVIDCGFSSNGGDLGFIPEENSLKAYTPVPGGVGALTSYCLILNALTLIKKGK